MRRALERVAELLVMGGWELRARGGWELACCRPRAASRSADASRLVCAERYGGLGPPAKRGLPPGAPKATGGRKQKKSHASAGGRSGVGNFGGFVAGVAGGSPRDDFVYEFPGRAPRPSVHPQPPHQLPRPASPPLPSPRPRTPVALPDPLA